MLHAIAWRVGGIEHLKFNWKSAVLRNIEDDVRDAIVDGAASIPSPLSVFRLNHNIKPQRERH